jgi:hypothetical protein
MGERFEHDVFLSPSRVDKPRVRRRAERLRVAGLRVRPVTLKRSRGGGFDEWVIKPGGDIYLAIERGLEASSMFVFCLSQAAPGADWVGWARTSYRVIGDRPKQDAVSPREREPLIVQG